MRLGVNGLFVKLFAVLKICGLVVSVSDDNTRNLYNGRTCILLPMQFETPCTLTSLDIISTADYVDLTLLSAQHTPWYGADKYSVVDTTTTQHVHGTGHRTVSLSDYDQIDLHKGVQLMVFSNHMSVRRVVAEGACKTVAALAPQCCEEGAECTMRETSDMCIRINVSCRGIDGSVMDYSSVAQPVNKINDDVCNILEAEPTTPKLEILSKRTKQCLIIKSSLHYSGLVEITDISVTGSGTSVAVYDGPTEGAPVLIRRTEEEDTSAAHIRSSLGSVLVSVKPALGDGHFEVKLSQHSVIRDPHQRECLMSLDDRVYNWTIALSSNPKHNGINMTHVKCAVKEIADVDRWAGKNEVTLKILTDKLSKDECSNDRLEINDQEGVNVKTIQLCDIKEGYLTINVVTYIVIRVVSPGGHIKWASFEPSVSSVYHEADKPRQNHTVSDIDNENDKSKPVSDVDKQVIIVPVCILVLAILIASGIVAYCLWRQNTKSKYKVAVYYKDLKRDV